MPLILTKSNKADRQVEVEQPECLNATNLSEVVSIVGEDVAFKKIIAQLTVDFRAHIRTKLESETNGDMTYSDDEIINVDYSEWKPEARQRKSLSEKAAEMFGKMTPEQIKQALMDAGHEI